MIQLFVVLTLVTASQQNPSDIEAMQRKYGRQVLVNSVLGFACTIGMGVFHVKGNDAYEEYKDCQSVQSAAEAWDRVVFNDTARNVFAVGAVFFLTRAAYYHIKRIRHKSSSVSAVFDVQYVCGPKMSVGFRKDL